MPPKEPRSPKRRFGLSRLFGSRGRNETRQDANDHTSQPHHYHDHYQDQDQDHRQHLAGERPRSRGPSAFPMTMATPMHRAPSPYQQHLGERSRSRGPSTFPMPMQRAPSPPTYAPPVPGPETHLPQGQMRFPVYVAPAAPSATSYKSTLRHLVMAEHALDTDNYPRALTLYTSVPSCPYHNPTHALFNAAQIATLLFLPKEARSHLSAAVRLDPQFIVGWFQLGAILAQLQDWKGAVNAFEQCVVRMNRRESAEYEQLGLAWRVQREDVLWNRAACLLQGRGWEGQMRMVPAGAVFRVDPRMAERRETPVGEMGEWGFGGRGRVIGASNSWFPQASVEQQRRDMRREEAEEYGDRWYGAGTKDYGDGWYGAK